MEERTTLRWEQVNDTYDLVLKNPEAVQGATRETLEACLEKVSTKKGFGRQLSRDAVKELRRWLDNPQTPLKGQTYARLSNWFKTSIGAARESDLGDACAEFWNALFCAEPKRRLTDPKNDHKILSEEFALWWPVQQTCQ